MEYKSGTHWSRAWTQCLLTQLTIDHNPHRILYVSVSATLARWLDPGV